MHASLMWLGQFIPFLSVVAKKGLEQFTGTTGVHTGSANKRNVMHFQLVAACIYYCKCQSSQEL